MQVMLSISRHTCKISSPVTLKEHWSGGKELSTFDFNAFCWSQSIMIFERIGVSQFAGISKWERYETTEVQLGIPHHIFTTLMMQPGRRS